MYGSKYISWIVFFLKYFNILCKTTILPNHKIKNKIKTYGVPRLITDTPNITQKTIITLSANPHLKSNTFVGIQMIIF